MIARACQTDLSNMNGALSRDNLPLPRKPLALIRCSSMPAAGTSSFSMPRGVPEPVHGVAAGLEFAGTGQAPGTRGPRCRRP